MTQIDGQDLPLPAPMNQKLRLAKFVNYQHDDSTWFEIDRKTEDQINILIRRTGPPEINAIKLSLKEAHAFYDLLTAILERGNKNV